MSRLHTMINGFDAISGAAFGGGGGGGRSRGSRGRAARARRAAAASRARAAAAARVRVAQAAQTARAKAKAAAAAKKAAAAPISSTIPLTAATAGASFSQPVFVASEINMMMASNKAKPEKSWHRIGTVHDGDTTNVKASGKVKIECADALGGIHLNSCSFYGTFNNINSQGASEAGVYPNYKGTLTSGASNVFTGSQTFDAGTGAKLWTFGIDDRQTPVSGNTGSPQLNIYEWR